MDIFLLGVPLPALRCPVGVLQVVRVQRGEGLLLPTPVVLVAPFVLHHLPGLVAPQLREVAEQLHGLDLLLRRRLVPVLMVRVRLPRD